MNINGINMYTMQQAQQVYQSQIHSEQVFGEQRVRETTKQVPRFVDELARATEPVIRKQPPRTEGVTQEQQFTGYLLFRAMNGYNSIPRNVYSVQHYAGSAASSYSSTMQLAGTAADYTDYRYGGMDIRF